MTTRSCNRVWATLVACGTIGLLSAAAGAQQAAPADKKFGNAGSKEPAKAENGKAAPASLSTSAVPMSRAEALGLVYQHHNQMPAAGGGGIVRGPSAATDDCTSAPVVNEGFHAFDTTGYNVDGPAGTCAGNGSGNGWWIYQATQDGNATVTTCGLAGFDTALAAFSGDCFSAFQVACNDDACGLQSSITFPVTNGSQYLVRISGFGSATGSGSISISVASVDCAACPGGATVIESEPECGHEGGSAFDTVNGGCNSPSPVFTSISVGDLVCGTTQVVSGTSRDTDWFSFTLTGGTEVTWTATAEFPLLIGFINSPCPQGGFIPGGFITAPACSSASVTLCLPAGTYYAFVASSDFGTAVNCGGAGSRYFAQLSGVPCSPYVPPNDDCNTAIALSVGFPEFGDNTNANSTTTLDGGSGCTFAGAPSNNDVWYTFTPVATGTFQVNTCGSALDTVLSIWTSCPGSQFVDMIACNDDSCGLQSAVTLDLTGGQTYFVRVSGWNNAQGTFTVVVNDLGNLPPGDLCSTAHVVNEGTHNYDTTVMTVGGGPASTCAGNGSNAEWFEYQATQTGLATVTTCGLAFWDTALAAYASCSGPQLACNDDACGLQSTIQFGVTSGSSYWIRISGFGSSTGSGSLEISVAPPRNDDECNSAGVPALSENTFYFGDTFGATTSLTGLIDGQCGTFTGSAGGSDVWATFTPASTSQYEISLCGSAYDTVLAVFSGCPADAFANLEGCNDDFCGLQSQLTLVLNGGTTYYIRIAGYAAAQGSWQLVINNIGAPAGRCCTGNTCTVVDEVTCLNGGGVWGGPGTDCQGAAPAYTASSQPNLFINSFHQDTITIVGGQTITDLDVGIMMPHAWQGDVIVTLTSPMGTTVTLIDEPGNPPFTFGFDTDNFGDQGSGTPFILDDQAPNSQTYDSPQVAAGINNVSGRWLPDLGPLSAFNGENSAGTWTLTVIDVFSGADDGTLVEWGLWVNPTFGAACGSTCPADWDGNNTVEVNDIFAFLTAWFANVPAAVNFGGTPGVPAIFAFLTVWFAHGVGPC
ncbi:MAG: proprotein convertase P-domain-containing protein [Phycisphaeraceae bacterium]|nr:proprotein convertase P-domain-containing protein [Phycisphaeraceae bacterium]